MPRVAWVHRVDMKVSPGGRRRDPTKYAAFRAGFLDRTMLKLLPIALLATAPVRAEVPIDPPAECGDLPVGDVRLASTEFDLDIEPGTGQARLRFPDRIAARADRPALEIVGGLFTVPLASEHLDPVRAAHDAGVLEALLGLSEAPGPRARPGCAELVVERIHLKTGDVLISSAHVAHPDKGRLKLGARVRVAALQLEPGSAPVPEELLQEKLKQDAEFCLRSEMGALPVNGSVSIEIRAREPGMLMQPQATVDSLMQQPLLFCLLNRIYHNPELARTLPGGAWFYAPFYFRPDDSERLLIHSQAP
jgi:hypothetical protein